MKTLRKVIAIVCPRCIGTGVRRDGEPCAYCDGTGKGIL